MISFRALGIVMLLPTLGASQMPPTLRMGIALGLASILYGIVPHVASPPETVFAFMVAGGAEIVLGLAMGFIGRLSFGAVEMAGRVMTQEIGLGGIPGIDTPRPSQEPLAALLTMYAGLLFFLSGSHLGCLAAFARSFDFAPAGQAAFGATSGRHLIWATGHVVELGFRIAAPFIAMNFLINLAFSVLGRAVPRMNVFVVSYSLRSMVGLGLLASAGMLVARYMCQEFSELPGRMLELLPLAR
jgi:flagellar biosynthetic protein FliR